jgi:hypothetical protein
MAKYLKRSCPKCGDYLGIVVPERKPEVPVQAINGHCFKCGYRLAWILIAGKRSAEHKAFCEAAGKAVQGGLLRAEPLIDPFLCLLKEALFSFGFCSESIDCSSHNVSPKPSAFFVFNSSYCAPVVGSETSPYFESDSVPPITVHFFHKNPVGTDVYRQKIIGARPEPRVPCRCNLREVIALTSGLVRPLQ